MQGTSPVTCSNHLERCNRTVTLPTSSCGSTNVMYQYRFCNYEQLPFTFQPGICNTMNAGFDGRSGNCSFAFLDGKYDLPMNFTSPMSTNTCRSLNYSAIINTCNPTPAQIQVQGRLSDTTYCRSYIFLRVNWVPADPPKKTTKPSSKPTTKPSSKPITSPGRPSSNGKGGASPPSTAKGTQPMSTSGQKPVRKVN